MTRAKLSSNFIKFLADQSGRKRSAITEKTKLGDLGFDGYALVNLAEKIDETSWMHGVQIQAHDILQCSTVGDVVDFLYGKLK
jgi:acyl carrier protein